jgi:hypothetical protein
MRAFNSGLGATVHRSGCTNASVSRHSIRSNPSGDVSIPPLLYVEAARVLGSLGAASLYLSSGFRKTLRTDI